MKDFSKLVLGIAVVLLGLLSFFLWTQNQKLQQQSNFYLNEKTSINNDYDALQSEFDELTIEMTSFTEASNNEISQQKKELEEQKVKISRLLRKERLTKTELDQAKGMIASLRKQKDSLLIKIKDLNAENATLNAQNKNLQINLTNVGNQKKALETANQTLNQEKEVLVAEKQQITEQKIAVEQQKATIEQEKAKVEEQKQIVEQQKEQAVQQKNALEQEKVKNAPKVQYAELLKVNSLNVQGIKYRNNGAEKETSNFKKVDKLAIRFKAGNNPVATNGTKEFYVRIINPDGTVMYDKQRGSGVFTNQKTEGMKYTTKTAIDYQAAQKDVTLFWRQDLPYQKGNYTVEVYQDGYKVSNGSFELKSGL